MRNPTWTISLRDKVDALKRAVDLRDLFVERYPGRFRRSGNWLYGSSPYRRDDHPSFAVNEAVYIDFATGERGDEIDFLMREQGLSFKEALAALETRAGGYFIAPLTPRAATASQPARSEPPPDAWQTVLRTECQRAHEYLFSSQPDARRARRWLRERGLKPKTVWEAGIGFNPAWRETRLRERTTARRVSIAPGIVIPCLVDGALWSVHIRTLPELLPETGDLPKYLFVRGSKTGALYNGDCVTPNAVVLIVEGEFDALLAQQALGNRAVVVTLGSATNRLPPRWRERLNSAARVYSCLDADDAGRRAVKTLAAQLGDKHRALCLPQGKDITEFVVTHRGSLLHWWRGETAQDEPVPVQLRLF